FGEVAFVPGVGGFLLGFHRKAVDICTAEAFQSGDQVCTDTLRHEACVQVGFRVGSPGAAVRAHGHAGHGFNAARYHHVLPAGAYFHGSQVDGFQAGGAETVQGDAGHFLVPVGGECGGFGNVCALVAYGSNATHHNVVHLGGIQLVTFLQGLELGGEQTDGFYAVQ